MVGGSRIDHLKMILLAVEDISERKQAGEALRRSEEHLRQSQKMEAIGQARRRHRSRLQQSAHGHHRLQRLLLDTSAGNEDALEQVQEIKTAGERAAALTSSCWPSAGARYCNRR